MCSARVRANDTRFVSAALSPLIALAVESLNVSLCFCWGYGLSLTFGQYIDHNQCLPHCHRSCDGMVKNSILSCHIWQSDITRHPKTGAEHNELRLHSQKQKKPSLAVTKLFPQIYPSVVRQQHGRVCWRQNSENRQTGAPERNAQDADTFYKSISELSCLSCLPTQSDRPPTSS